LADEEPKIAIPIPERIRRIPRRLLRVIEEE
jgi:hypothetical protein